MGNDEAYGRSKAACERYARTLQDDGRPVVTVYPSSIVGPDDWTESINLSSAVMWFEKGFPDQRRGSAATMSTSVTFAAVGLGPRWCRAGGPKRLLAFGSHVDARAHVAALTEATGAKIKTFPTPRWFMWTWGRLGDLTRRYGRDIVMTQRRLRVPVQLCRAGDDSATVEAHWGAVPPPWWRPSADMARWMYETGTCQRREGGRPRRRLTLTEMGLRRWT